MKKNPNYLTDKKLDDLATKKELEKERTFHDYIKTFGGLTDEDVDQIIAIIGKRIKPENLRRLRSILRYSSSSIPHYSIVDRLTKQHGKWSYTAGQSYADEVASLRKIILTETSRKFNPSEPEHERKMNDLFEFAKMNIRGTRNEEHLNRALMATTIEELDKVIKNCIDPRVCDYASYKKAFLIDHGQSRKSNPNYLTEKFSNVDKIEELMDRGYEVYSDNYRTSIAKKDLVKHLFDAKAFLTSDLFRYTDYGGGYNAAKANIRYIKETYPKLIDEELIQSYSTAYNGENMEFKFAALSDENLYEDLLSLYDYPVLDDGTLSEVEMELEDECWDSYGRDDWKEALIKKYGEDVESMSDDELDSLAYEASQYTCCGRGEVEAMNFIFDIKGMLDAIDKLKDGFKLKKKSNPLPKCENPSWAADEDIWEKAKKESLKSYGKISYPFVVFLYKQMGGKTKKKK